MNKRSRRILIAAGLIGGLAAAAYAAAPTALAAIVKHALRNVVEISELEIESVGLNETVVSAVRLNDKQVRFGAQQATVRYTLWPLSIRGVEIERASLAVEQLDGGGGQAPAMPALPAFPLRVDALTLTAATPWGEATAEVSVAVRPGGAGGLAADIHSGALALTLANPSPDEHRLVVRDGNNILLSVNVDTGGGYPLRLAGRVEPQAVARWWHDTDLLPARLKEVAAPYEISSSGVDFTGDLQEDHGFTVQPQGDLVARDRRGETERLFERLSLRADPDYTIEHRGAAWSGTGDGDFEFSLDPGSTVTGRQPQWRWEDGALAFRATGVELPQLGLGAAALDVSASPLTAGAASGEISIEDATAAWWPEGLDEYAVEGRWAWRESSLQAEGSADAAALPPLTWKVDTGPAGGSLSIVSQAPLAGLERSLRQYTQAVAQGLKIHGGALDAHYQLDWDGATERTSLSLTAGPVDADLDEMELRGLELRLTNRNAGLDELGLDVSAPSLKLAAGAVAEEFEMALRISPPRLHIDTARTRLFGGEIVLRPTTIDLNDQRFVFLADISALSLERVMALLELENTQLTGAVAGPVRVVYTPGRGIELNEGALHSIRPGVLRFNLERDSAMSAQLDNIALRALQNFQYQELNASVLYKPDGEYRITARIVGNNPEVLDGHPIALNPNIEGRLPALFRAFFLTGDFSQAIIERLQKERATSTPGETSTFE